MMWQLAHAAGSLVRYDEPRAYPNVNTPRPRMAPMRMPRVSLASMECARAGFVAETGIEGSRHRGIAGGGRTLTHAPAIPRHRDPSIPHFRTHRARSPRCA